MHNYLCHKPNTIENIIPVCQCTLLIPPFTPAVLKNTSITPLPATQHLTPAKQLHRSFTTKPNPNKKSRPISGRQNQVRTRGNLFFKQRIKRREQPYQKDRTQICNRLFLQPRATIRNSWCQPLHHKYQCH